LAKSFRAVPGNASKLAHVGSHDYMIQYFFTSHWNPVFLTVLSVLLTQYFVVYQNECQIVKTENQHYIFGENEEKCH